MRDPGLREHRRAELQVGVLVLVSFLALLWGVVFVSNASLGSVLRVYATTTDAGQITNGARIYLMGVDVGAVRDVELEGRQVLLTLSIDYAGTLPADTRGEIVPSGFLGNQMVVLVPGTAPSPLGTGDTISLIRIPDLQALVEDLGDQATVALEGAGNLLSDEMAADVHYSSAAMASAMAEFRDLLAEQRETLNALFTNLNSSTQSLAAATAGGRLERTFAQIDTLTGQLSGAGAGLDSASHALASILNKMDAGEGTLGKLSQDEELYVQIAAAMENLQAATEELALLSKDLRERPERYLKGLKFSVF